VLLLVFSGLETEKYNASYSVHPDKLPKVGSAAYEIDPRHLAAARKAAAAA
jgi:hypothetical protein